MSDKVLGYIRVSTGEQGKKFSLGAQIEEIKRYCESENLELIRIFEDQSSGTRLQEREGLMSLIESINKSLKAVIVTEADRLSRDIFHFGWLYTHFRQQGVDLVLINDRTGTTPSERAFSKVRAVFSEFEHDLRRARIERGLRRAREQGKFMNRPPLGYRMENNRIVVDQKKSVIVSGIFQLAAQGFSLSQISQKMLVSKSSVGSILKNPFYIDGTLHGNHETFLETVLWQKVQQIKNSHIKHSESH